MRAAQQRERTRGRRQKRQQQDDRPTVKVCRCAIGQKSPASVSSTLTQTIDGMIERSE